MNKRGQVFLIASLIIIGIIISVVVVQNQAYSKDIFLPDKALAREFEVELREVIDGAIINNQNPYGPINDYVNLFLSRGIEKDINWKIAVQYNGENFTRGLPSLNILSPKESRIYYRIISEKNGETFARENI